MELNSQVKYKAKCRKTKFDKQSVASVNGQTIRKRIIGKKNTP